MVILRLVPPIVVGQWAECSPSAEWSVYYILHFQTARGNCSRLFNWYASELIIVLGLCFYCNNVLHNYDSDQSCGYMATSTLSSGYALGLSSLTAINLGRPCFNYYVTLPDIHTVTALYVYNPRSMHMQVLTIVYYKLGLASGLIWLVIQAAFVFAFSFCVCVQQPVYIIILYFYPIYTQIRTLWSCGASKWMTVRI